MCLHLSEGRMEPFDWTKVLDFNFGFFFLIYFFIEG